MSRSEISIGKRRRSEVWVPEAGRGVGGQAWERQAKSTGVNRNTALVAKQLKFGDYWLRGR